MKHILFPISLFLLLTLSCRKDVSIDKVEDISYVDSQIIVRHWKLSGPFYNREHYQWRNIKNKANSPDEDKLDYVRYNQFKSNPAKNIFKEHPDSLKKQKKLSNYYQEIDFLSFNRTLSTKVPATAYAETTINSEIEQDVAFLMGLDGAIKMWVNGKLCLREPASYFAKNQYAIRVHLKEGENQVLVKSYNNAQSKEWGLHLDIASIAYARKYSIGRNWFSISQNSLVQENAPLLLRIKHPTFVPVNRPAKLILSDINNKAVINKEVQPRHQWKIPLDQIEKGIYKCTLVTDQDTFEQKFVYGNHQELYSKLVKQGLPYQGNDYYKINIETLQQRYLYLDSVGRDNKYLENTQIKIASTLYELADLLNRLSKKQNGLAQNTGLHLRGVRSNIDLSVNNYMLYIPEQYRPDKPIPLVMMMPYITRANPFTKSWHVADLDKIEYLKKLGRQFGFGILWPSSRTYAYYNLNPMAATATFEALGAVKKDYNIDNSRVYLYGDCTGGLLALITANRYPSYFAGVAVKGPELSYTNCAHPDYKCLFPGRWAQENSIFSNIENYHHLPILLMQTRNDAKADSRITEKLFQRLTDAGSPVIYDNLKNATRTKTIGLIPENNILYQTFQFFKSKQVKVPDTVTFSTFQSKYNQAYWITLNGKAYPGKSHVKAIFQVPNTIRVDVKNVSSITIELDKLINAKSYKEVRIVSKGKEIMVKVPPNKKLFLSFRSPNRGRLRKNHFIEGPVNHAFASSFLVVRGTSGTSAEKLSYNNALQTFSLNWQRNYFHGHRTKSDTQVDAEELKNNNLILIGSLRSNLTIKKVINQLPLRVTNHYVEINKKKYSGSNLNYMMIYPNPLNPRKYVVVIGSNFNNQDWSQIMDLPLRGWYDYEVWDKKAMIGSGYFDNNWR